jgi:hypothetical protein
MLLRYIWELSRPEIKGYTKKYPNGKHEETRYKGTQKDYQCL